MLVPVLRQAWVGKASQCLSRAGGVGSRFGRRLVSLREIRTSFSCGVCAENPVLAQEPPDETFYVSTGIAEANAFDPLTQKHEPEEGGPSGGRFVCWLKETSKK
jgi:hypothetical protein